MVAGRSVKPGGGLEAPSAKTPAVRQAQRPESQEAELEQEYEEQVQERCAWDFGKLE